MPCFICKTCGVQHADSPQPPGRCIICEDERQYVGWKGQQWTSLGQMKSEGFQNRFREAEPGLIGIDTQPRFAIGQRALLVQTPAGNFLWDCISYLDEDTIQEVRSLGGLRGVSVSHPHFYGVMVEWALAFDATLYLPEADRRWVVRQDGRIEWYEGAREVLPGVTLIQCGGHFEGSAVLHWPDGAEGRGALLTGDTIAPSQDRRYVSFMRSYPNYLPLPAASVRRIAESVHPYRFDRIYGGWRGNDISHDANAAVERSAERYIRQIAG